MCHSHTVVFYLAMKRKKKVCREIRLTESTLLNEVMQEWKVKNQFSTQIKAESIYISVSKWG